MNPYITNKITLLVFCCMSTFFFGQDDSYTIIYVDSTKTDNHKFDEMHAYGKEWGSAFRFLQDALNFGDQSATEIWIAKGTYYPDEGSGVGGGSSRSSKSTTVDQDVSFIIRNDVALYGGFDGTETSRTDRNVEANPTILDGHIHDRDKDDVSTTAYSEHLLYALNADLTLDGFTFQNIYGKTGISSDNDNGYGGIFIISGGKLMITNSVIQKSFAAYGALAHMLNGAELTITDSSIREITSYSDGAINITPSAGSFTMSNCIVDFTNWNEASSGDGSFIHIQDVDDNNNRTLTITNTVIQNSKSRSSSGVSPIDELLIIEEHANKLEMANLLFFNNYVGNSVIKFNNGQDSTGSVDHHLTNLSFIQNKIRTGDKKALIVNGENIISYPLSLSLYNSLFFGNKILSENTEQGIAVDYLRNNTSGTITVKGSHNASDNATSHFVTDASFASGKVDLSSQNGDGLFESYPTDPSNLMEYDWLENNENHFVPSDGGLLTDKGTDNGWISQPALDSAKDIRNHSRKTGSAIDIGAYEFGEQEATLEIEGLSGTSELVLYPNPIRSSKRNSLLGYLTDPSSKPTRLVLRDLSGKLVRDLAIEDSGKGIELGVLPSATYLAILSTENKGYKSFKLVVD